MLIIHIMKKNIGYILFLSLLLMGFASCYNEDPSGILVELNVLNAQPDTVTKKQVLESGSKYELQVLATNFWGNNFSRLKITSFDQERSNVLVLDTIVSGSQLNFSHIYTAPYLSKDSTDISFTIDISDQEGHALTWTFRNKYTIKQSDRVLLPQTGIIMYAFEQNNKGTGYSFDRQSVIMTSLADSSEVDIYACQEAENGDALSGVWETRTGVYFIKNNSFDYARATYNSVNNAYRSSTGYHKVNKLQTGDIILVGKGTSPIGVICVQGVYDEPGTDHDRYVFDIKYM